ncbi:hypothetical protein HDV62DRAFT_309028 [Trichoderma sp. SZMC 28011]
MESLGPGGLGGLVSQRCCFSVSSSLLFPILPSWLSKFPVIVYNGSKSAAAAALNERRWGSGIYCLFLTFAFLFFFLFLVGGEAFVCVYVSLWDNLLLFLR